ncbi:Cytochrome C oxidase, cbb3-type, subunit III [Pedobacter insulae]|uniref:Cytochrome C oxidase, cbb3-type, subunit III n=2 Tax=Pedobacter insulae TaxID=414048 RepID=A0A1I2TGK5_9SPHI|nr:Cytochrome C oxidase, cbb3-type, subunit III [Pedobacter insulae]
MLAMNKKNIVYAAFTMLASVAMLSACRDSKSTGLEYARNMYDPIAYNQDQPNKNFANGQTAQSPPANTDPIGFVRYEFANTPEGLKAAEAAVVNPLPVTEQNLLEGKHYYEVFCGLCHGEKGDGNGPITLLEKGITAPAFHGEGKESSRGGLMSELSTGRIYQTIMYGYNAMGSHASQLTPSERWKVVMYVQQLQKIK